MISQKSLKTAHTSFPCSPVASTALRNKSFVLVTCESFKGVVSMFSWKKNMRIVSQHYTLALPRPRYVLQMYGSRSQGCSLRQNHFLTNMHMKLQLYVGWLMIIQTDFRNLTSPIFSSLILIVPPLIFVNFGSFRTVSLPSQFSPWGPKQTILPPCWTNWDPVLYEPNEPRSSPRFQAMTKVIVPLHL